MTATTADRPRVRPGRALLTAAAAVLYAFGWALGMLWVPVAWAGTAVLVGWRDATGGR